MVKVMSYINKNTIRNIEEAANVIKNGGLVLFPTETVYGIGADGLNASAVRRIFEAKGRASDNPLILHVSNIDMVENIATNITDIEYKLMDAFWPGPFTIVLTKKDIVPNEVSAGLKTVAVRMPSNEIARKLIEYAGTPIAAPSANVSGRPSGTCVEDIYDELAAKMDYIIDGGRCEVGIESTVVKVEGEKVRILRPGKITKEQIENIVNSVILDEHIFNAVEKNQAVMSPGMKYKHYAPNTRCLLIYSEENDKMVTKIKELSEKYANPVVICSDENNKHYSVKTLKYGNQNNLESIASNIFSCLREVDKLKADIVLIEGVKKEGVGIAIMNRLLRACSYEYIEL